MINLIIYRGKLRVKSDGYCSGYCYNGWGMIHYNGWGMIHYNGWGMIHYNGWE